MTTAASSYIYLTQNHFMSETSGSEAALVNKLNSKERILDNAIQQHHDRIQEIASKFDASVEQKFAEILEGSESWLEDLDSFIIPDKNIQTAGKAQYGDLITAATALKESATKHGKQIGEYKKRLSEFIDSLETYISPEDQKLYAKSVLNKFLNSGRYGSKSAKAIAAEMFPGGTSKQTGVARMLGSLINNYKGQAFRVVDNISGDEAQAKLSVALGKLIVLKSALNTNAGRTYISKLGQSGRNEFYQEIQANTGKWINDITALVEEIAHVTAIDKAVTEMEKKYGTTIDQVKSTHRMSGGKNIMVNTKLEQDPRMQEDMKKVHELFGRAGGTVMSMLNAGTPKADVLFNMSDGSVSATVGLSVKKSEDLNFNSNLQSVPIRLQDNTPLLTLFYREANLSYDDLTTFINVGAARPLHPSLQWDDYTYEAQLANDWNTIVEGVKYRAFYACLAGLGGSDVENVFFMSINGRIFTIATLLQYVKKRVNEKGIISWDSHQARGAQIAGNGLNRNSYQALNENSFKEPHKPRRAYAPQRSADIRNRAIKLMQETKLSMSMNIQDLSSLVR